MGVEYRKLALWFLATSALAAAILLSVAMGLKARFGSVANGVSYLRGERIVLLPRTVELGDAQENDVREFRVKVTNLTANPVEILGARSTCGCVVIKEDLPFKMAPGESHWLAGNVTFAGGSDELLHSITVYSDISVGGMASAVVRGYILRVTQPNKR